MRAEIRVTVHLHTVLQKQTPDGLVRRLEMTAPANSTMMDLFTQLEIEMPLDAILLVVNGRIVPPNHPLQDQDEVHFMPAISGG